MVTKSVNLGSSSLVNWDRDRGVDVKLDHMSVGRFSFLVDSSDIVNSLLVVVKLDLGLHGVREARHISLDLQS